MSTISNLRKCIKCLQKLPLASFNKHSSGSYRSVCRDCQSAARRKDSSKPQRRVRYINIEKKERECSICGVVKPFDQFYLETGAKGGVSHKCKTCKEAYRRYKKNGGVPADRLHGRIDVEARVRECTVCRQVLPFSSFGVARRMKGGVKSCCKACEHEKRKRDRGVRGKHQQKVASFSIGKAENAGFICATCEEQKSVSEFYKNDKTGRVERHCKCCMAEHERLRYNNGRSTLARQSRYVSVENQRAQCACCGIIKPFSEFFNSRSGPGGKIARCKVCTQIDRRKARNAGVDPGPRKLSVVIVSKELKLCLCCDTFKPVTEFYLCSGTPSGRQSRCKDCTRKATYENSQARLYKNVRSRSIMSLKRAVARYQRGTRDIEAFRLNYDIGCSVSELVQYFETLFYKNPRTGEEMTWENCGKSKSGSEGWQIDHIVPLSRFDLRDADQVKAACNFRNLQPLWTKDNLAKRNKLLSQDESRTVYLRGVK